MKDLEKIRSKLMWFARVAALIMTLAMYGLATLLNWVFQASIPTVLLCCVLYFIFFFKFSSPNAIGIIIQRLREQQKNRSFKLNNSQE